MGEFKVNVFLFGRRKLAETVNKVFFIKSDGVVFKGLQHLSLREEKYSVISLNKLALYLELRGPVLRLLSIATIPFEATPRVAQFIYSVTTVLINFEKGVRMVAYHILHLFFSSGQDDGIVLFRAVYDILQFVFF